MLGDPRYRRAGAVAVLVVVIDQLTKALVERSMDLHESIPVLSFLALTYTRNTGAAFSLLAHAPPAVRLTLFLSVSVAAIVMVWRYVGRAGDTQYAMLVGLGAVLGGAIGNMIDRVRFGEVRDFIELHYHQWSWPVFNMADAAICTGVGLLLVFPGASQPQHGPDPTRGP